MALTEKYVSVAGGGAHDGTTEADAWTFAEMITAAPAAGTRVNVISGTYSVGAYTVGTGTAAAPFVIRGYNTTIGDLDNQGRNADGTLNTTNMPDITITALWTPGALSILQNLDITGALSSALISSSTIDNIWMISCRTVNTQNNAVAKTVFFDQSCQFINCDFECNGAAHSAVVNPDGAVSFFGCRFKGSDADALVQCSGGIFEFCAFVGNAGATNKGIMCDLAITPFSVPLRVINCTFYNLATCIETPNLVNTGYVHLINNHATDCSKFYESLYSATATVPVIDFNNRTRDITTLYTGAERVTAGAVTTDTGGASTDYTDAAAGNLRLISAAPGKGVGMPAYLDAGAYQREEAAGGGGMMRNPPLSGGMI